MKKTHQGPTLRSRRLAFETLEPRALLSADLLPVAELPEPAPPLPAEFREDAAASAALPAVALGAETPRELVIIDTGVQGADALAQDWARRGFEVVVLDPARDALDQIGTLLGERRGLDAVHLVSHGTAGGLQLGDTLLDAADLSARAAEVARWADAFAADGDLLLYGCDVADGETGRAFAERLALLTGADVAASADATGAALLGGDWTLEHAHGAIESASLPPVDAWLGLLVVDTLDWDAVLLAGDWPDSSLGPNNLTTALGGTVVGTVTGDTGFLVDVGGGDPRITPVVVDRVDAGTGENTLQLQMDGLAPGQGVTLTLDFSAYAFGVSNISFTVFDVDSGGFIDRITVTSDRGDPTTLVASSVNTTSGTDTIVGSGAGNSPNNSPNGNATFTYTWSLANDNSGIRTLTIRYGNDGGPVGQGIGIHDLTFDPTPGASDRTVNTTENVAYTFSTGDFGFQDVGGDALESVRITQLPTAGTLRLNGAAVTLGQSIAAADIAANLLTFHPAANASGAGYSNFRFRVGDGTSLSQSDYAMTVNVAAVNDAPTLAGGPFALAGTNEDTASAGTLVSALLAGLTHGDLDAGALSGIAVTASAGNGTWQYSTDGVTWNGVGGVAANSALLLSDTTRVRYVPDGANGETAQLTFRAWDRTSGLASTNATRQTADTTANGGTTAFSAGTAQATITVADVNDAPVLNAGRTPVLASVSEDAPAPVGAVGTLVSSLVDYAVPAGQVDNVTDVDTGAQLGIALIGADTTQGTWHYSLNNGASWTALPAVGPANALLLAADAGTRLYFQPNPDYAGTLASAITFRAWDRTSGSAGALANPGAGGSSSAFSAASDTASLTVIGANDAPVIGNLAGDARGYAAGSGAVVVDQGAAATVIDVDSANFDGGELRIAIAAGEVAAEDVLAIATGPSVSLSAGMTVGSVVTVSGAAIGTITSTSAGGADLVIALDADATPARVTTLVGAITYANSDATSPTPGTRTIRFTLTDGDGGTSANIDATVTVKPVASIAATDAAAAEPGNDGRYTVTLSAASATDTTIAYLVTGTATGGTDYVALTGQVTLLAGMTTAFIDVDILDDLRVEAAETVIVTLDAITVGDPDIRVDTTAAGATVTLADNDTVTLTVADVTVNEAAGSISFSVVADRAVDGGFSVDALFGGGTATGSGTDYANVTQTLAFAGTAGETQVVTLAIVNDLIVEANETFTLSLGNVTAPVVSTGAFDVSDTATGTITNDDVATLTVANVAVSEAAGTISFSVVADRAVDGGFSVDALFGGGTATGSGTDYASATQTLVFAGTAGEAQVVTLAIVNDLIVEANETFTLSLGNVTAPTVSTGAFDVSDTAAGTITNDDTVTLIVADVSVGEAAGTISFSVVADRAVDGGFSVDALFGGGTATGSGTDYASAVQTLAFAGAAGEIRIVTLAVTNDLVVEANETFTLSLGNVTAPTVSTGAFDVSDTATGTITNDDTTTLTVGDSTINEAAGTISFSVVLDRAVQGGFSVDALFGGGTATGSGTDYDSAAQTLAFAGTAGEVQVVTLTTNNDLIVEANETFTVSLGNLVPATAPGGAIAITDTATGTILDNDTAALGVADVTANEAAGTISFSVVLDRAVQGGFSVDALFGGGTATGAGTDYASTTQTLAFAGTAGEVQVVTLTINNDLIVEANETFALSLGNLAPATAPGGAITVTDTATGTITNDDVATLTVANVAVSEAAGTISFSVVANRAVDGGFSVDALFGGGTATGSGADYASNTQTLAFAGAAGEVQVVTLAMTNDLIVEANETFTLSLGNVTAPTVSNGAFDLSDTATGTITNDDVATLTVANVTASEAAGTISFSVVADRAVDGGFSVDALFGGGTATGSGTDYDSAAQTLSFTGNAGEIQVVTLAITNDLIVEANETFTVSLGNVTAPVVSTGAFDVSDTATGTILDNDTAALTVADATVNEAAGTISFSVALDRAVQGGFGVDALFGGGTATGSGTDYDSTAQTLAFAGTAGEVQVVTLAINGDLIVEANETFTLSLGNLAPATAPGGAIAITDTATGTILDNDTAALSVADVTVNENTGTISFSVVLDRAVQGGFSVDALFGGGTATGGGDYDATTQTLAFAGAAGEVQVVTLPLFDDPLVEADETFTISLANVATGGAPAGAISVADTATGTIANDDSAPTIADTSVVLPENSAATTLVLDLQDALTGTDADPDGDAITYALIGGNAAGAFTIDAATGMLTVANSGPLDFETTPVFVLTVQATDGTNTDTATLTIDLVNVNEAPTVMAPATGTVAEDAAAGFSAAGGNAITVADVDAATLRLTLTATNGVLSLGSLAGLAFTAGDGTADATMTFSGSIADLNSALDGLAFAPAANYNGAAVVGVLAEDLGQSGSGGPRSGAAAVAMTVTPVNDAPTIGGDLALLVLEGQAVTVLSADLLGVDVDDIGAGLVFEVVAAPGRGRMEFADAPGVAITSFTQADLDAGRVRYAHDGSETTADQFTLRLSDGGEDGAAPALGILDVVVVPVNDAPTLATGGGDVDEGARIVLTAALVSAFDPDNGADALLFTLDTVIGGYVELAGAAGVPITSFTGAQLDAGLVRFVQADGAVAPAFRVTVSDGQAADGPRVVVLTLRAAGGLTQDAPAREAPSGLLTAAAFRDDARLAEVRSPQLTAFLREPKLVPAGPTLAEPEPMLPAAPVTRVAGAALQTPPIELAAAGLRFAPPPPGEVAVPRIDFSFEPGRHNLEPPEGGAPLGIAAIDAVRVAGLALTAGGVWWVFRMGSLIGSALVSAPAWRHIDPLPVLGGGSRENVEWDAPDEPPTDDASDASERYFDGDDTANSQRR